MFVSYAGSDGATRAWDIKKYLSSRGVDVFTYTDPAAPLPPRIELQDAVDRMSRLIDGYPAVIVVLSPLASDFTGRGSYVAMSEILDTHSKGKYLFALPVSDVEDSMYTFEEKVMFLPKIKDLGLFFFGRDAD